MFENFATDYLCEVRNALASLIGEMDKLRLMARVLSECKGTIWLLGNGGSATLASHMATDLQLAGLRAISLTDVAAVTTYANDVAFNAIFREQLTRLARHGDLVLGLTTSGLSENVNQAIDWANARGLVTLGIVGDGEGSGAFQPDVSLVVKSTHTGVVQDVQQAALHVMTYYLGSVK